jgi:26S proteasome regulatory subunit N2
MRPLLHHERTPILKLRMLTCVRHSEALYEDDTFPERELAALVAAKVYYQLQEYNESMVFALGAGKLFDIHKAGEFEETILGKTR